MNSSMLVYEMAATVERERMVEIARLSRMEMVAQAGHDGGLPARAMMRVRALVRRMGRPRYRGAAPAAGRFARRSAAGATGAALGSSVMMIARF